MLMTDAQNEKIIFLRQKNSNIIHNVGLFSETHCRCFEKVTGDVASIVDTYYEVSMVDFPFIQEPKTIQS